MGEVRAHRATCDSHHMKMAGGMEEDLDIYIHQVTLKDRAGENHGRKSGFFYN